MEREAMSHTKHPFYNYALCILLFFLASLPILGGQENLKKITYDQAYMEGKPRLFKPLASIRGWLDDAHYLLEEREEKTKSQKLFKVQAETGAKTLFLDYDQIQKALPKGIRASQHVGVTEDYSGFLYSYKKDLYFYSKTNNSFKRMTATPSVERNPRFSPDGKLIAFTRNHNLYSLDIESGLEVQLTNDGSDTIYNGWASWVYYEEILGRRSRYAAFWWSPDSRKIAFLRFDDSPVPTFPLFRAGGAHGELEIKRYPKAGDSNPYVKLGIVPAAGGKIIWADIEEKADHYVAWPFWSRDSSQLTFQWMNRDQNNIKIYSVNPESGGKKELYDESQPAWVEFFEDLHFFEDGSGFLLRSDLDGWRHLYVFDLEGKLKKRLTKGEWTITNIFLVDEQNKRIFFHAKKGETTQAHLYRINLDGSGLTRITQQAGSHRGNVSPGGTYIIDSYSSVDSPSRQNLLRTDGTLIRNISDSRTDMMEEYTLGKKELFTVETEDGQTLPATWILPPDFDENKTYPVLFSIYGGPGSSRVSNSYPRLSQLYLAQEGIIIFSIDHRGSGHFGKKGMALMHRNLGKWEMHDLVQGVKWLHTKPFVDKTRIGITGGSYGGYTTCMALTYGADYFTHGLASASVTDWRLYDTVYTERYMDRPVDNPEGYTFGAVMTHAQKLKGRLLMTHGSMDDNVHMQNTIQLISKLMDLDKTTFEFMVYPNQRHGYRGKKRAHSSRQSVDFWFKHLLKR
jgi:dipeptidyl-peptidase-4